MPSMHPASTDATTSPAESPDQEHGYGDESDCTCGRNFAKVRGLREHLTKMRQRAGGGA